MSEAKKYLLVNPSNLDQLESLFYNKKRIEPLATRELYQLDKQMLEIIDNKTISEEEKVSKYNSII